MERITVYKVECNKGFMADEQGVSYRLQPWGQNTLYYEGCDDGGKEYILPAGLRIWEDRDGKKGIYDTRGQEHELINYKAGPAVIKSGSMEELQRVSKKE